jgi:hypothetical protein
MQQDERRVVILVTGCRRLCNTPAEVTFCRNLQQWPVLLVCPHPTRVCLGGVCAGAWANGLLSADVTRVVGLAYQVLGRRLTVRKIRVHTAQVRAVV